MCCSLASLTKADKLSDTSMLGNLLSIESIVGISGEELLMLCAVFIPAFGDGSTFIVACVLWMATLVFSPLPFTAASEDSRPVPMMPSLPPDAVFSTCSDCF